MGPYFRAFTQLLLEAARKREREEDENKETDLA